MLSKERIAPRRGRVAAPAQPGAGGAHEPAGGKNDRRGRCEKPGNKGPKGKGRPRSSTPSNEFGNSSAKQSRMRSLSETSRERQIKLARYAYSRDPRT
eukprot:5016100-Pyramimonas_sp.AAC.1